MRGMFLRRAFPSALPYAQRLAYIESTGTQRLDTLFKPNQNTRVVMDMAFNGGTGMFLSANSGSSSLYGLQMSSSRWYMYYGNVGSDTGKAVSYGSRLTLDMNKNKLYVGETLVKTMPSATFSCTHTLPLFCLNIGGSFSTYGAIRLYSCQIYDNGTLARDFIPVMDFDGVACLFDKVEKKLYYNAGTGAFAYAEVA